MSWTNWVYLLNQLNLITQKCHRKLLGLKERKFCNCNKKVCVKMYKQFY